MAGGGSDPGLMAAAEAELNQLEEVILSKVLQRVPARMGEETFLVKSFRYQDLSSSGWVDFERFKRTLLPFTAGIGEQDLRLIFDRYSSEGALAYKPFATEFVTGARRVVQQSAAPEMFEAYDTPEDTLQRLKAFVYSLGPRGVTSLALACREADEDSSRTLEYDAFRDVLVDFLHDMDCPIPEKPLDDLLDMLRQPYSPDQIAYDQFFLALKEEPGAERRAAVRAAFRSLDKTSEGVVDMAALLRAFNAQRHPQVSDGSRQPEEVLTEFQETLKDLITFRRGHRSYPSNVVAWEEFEDYYRLINGCFESDPQFIITMQRVWDLDKAPDPSAEQCAALARPAAGIPGKSRADLHHWQKNTLPSNVTHHDVARVANAPDVLLRTRQRIAQKGVRAAVDVVKNFYAADDDVDDQLDVYEFRKACQDSGFAFREAEEVSIFEACGAGAPGRRNAKIQVPVFLQLLQGELTGARRDVVERAFAALGGDPSDEGSSVSPAVLKDNFASEAHPQVVRGEMDPATALREFLDTFSLLAHVRGGCQNGLVTFADFFAYYEVVSSTVDNDAFFDLMVRRIWSLPSAGGQDGADSPRSQRPPSPRRGAGDAPSPMARKRPPAFEGPSAYARPASPRRAEPQPEEALAFDQHRRYQRKELGAAPGSPPPMGFSPITKSQIVFNSTGSGEVNSALSRLRESVSKRGLKGWKALSQKLEQNDHRRNGTIMRLDWTKAVKSLGLGLAPEELEIIYKGLAAARKDGAMELRHFQRLLRGAFPEGREAQVARLWEALQDGSGVVPAAALKGAFDAKNTPPCLLRKQSPADAAKDFAEAADYFAGGGVYDPTHFQDLFLMISAIHEDEDEFALMTTAAFGI